MNRDALLFFSGTIPKLIQVTLKKENGSFGMVIRGGDHEVMRKRRPFTVFGITPGGPTASEGTLRCGDRIRAINGISLGALKLPELQSMLYQQDKEAVFTVEYDVMISDNYHTVSRHLRNSVNWHADSKKKPRRTED